LTGEVGLEAGACVHTLVKHQHAEQTNMQLLAFGIEVALVQ
jgi:hypothetical protein